MTQPLEDGVRFTAGPWNVRPEPFERTGSTHKSRLVGANIGPDGESIRQPDGDVLNGGIWVAETKGPDAEANARLIAAAPSMYEALEAARAQILSLYTAISQDAEAGARFAANDPAFKAVEAALRLATGGRDGEG